MTFMELMAALDSYSYSFMRILLSVFWQSSLLIGVGALFAWALRNRSAKLRASFWTVAVLLIPLIPVFIALYGHFDTPRVELPVLPQYEIPAVRAQPVRIMSVPDPVSQSMYTEIREEATHSPLEYPWAFAGIFYIAGAGVFLWLTMLGKYRIRRWKRNAVIIDDSGIRAVFDSARASLGIERRYRLMENADVAAPFTCGVFRPLILLPEGYARTLTVGELRALAVHEFMHVKRFDPLVLEAVSFIRALFFFNPLIWFAARKVAELAETVCDDAAVSNVQSPADYADMLVRLASKVPGRMIATELAAGFLFSRHAFLRRIERVLSDRRKEIMRLSRTALAATALSGLALFVTAMSLPLGTKNGGNTAQSLTEAQADSVAVVLKNTAGKTYDRRSLMNLYQTQVTVTSQSDSIDYAWINKIVGHNSTLIKRGKNLNYLDIMKLVMNSRSVEIEPVEEVAVTAAPNSHEKPLSYMPKEINVRVADSDSLDNVVLGEPVIVTPDGLRLYDIHKVVNGEKIPLTDEELAELKKNAGKLPLLRSADLPVLQTLQVRPVSPGDPDKAPIYMKVIGSETAVPSTDDEVKEHAPENNGERWHLDKNNGTSTTTPKSLGRLSSSLERSDKKEVIRYFLGNSKAREYVDLVKNDRLFEGASATNDQAFKAVFKNREWNCFYTDDGDVVVVFKGFIDQPVGDSNVQYSDVMFQFYKEHNKEIILYYDRGVLYRRPSRGFTHAFIDKDIYWQFAWLFEGESKKFRLVRVEAELSEAARNALSQSPMRMDYDPGDTTLHSNATHDATLDKTKKTVVMNTKYSGDYIDLIKKGFLFEGASAVNGDVFKAAFRNSEWECREREDGGIEVVFSGNVNEASSFNQRSDKHVLRQFFTQHNDEITLYYSEETLYVRQPHNMNPAFLAEGAYWRFTWLFERESTSFKRVKVQAVLS